MTAILLSKNNDSMLQPLQPKDYYTKIAKQMCGVPSKALTGALIEFEEARKVPDFWKFLEQYVKQNVSVDETGKVTYAPRDEEGNSLEQITVKLQKYGLQLDKPQNCCSSDYGRHFSERYYDAPFNFCLTYNGKLIASIGFKPQNGNMFIKQIQGSHRRKGNLYHKYYGYLKPVKWERALVAYALEWAQKWGIPEVIIQAGEHNNWTPSLR